MRSSLIELQSFSLSELEIAPIYCILVNTRRIFRTPRFWVCADRIPDLDRHTVAGCWWPENRMPAFSEVEHHDFSNFVSLTIWLVDMSSVPLSLNQVPVMTNICAETSWHMLQRLAEFTVQFSSFLGVATCNVILHCHEDDPSLKLLRFTL